MGGLFCGWTKEAYEKFKDDADIKFVFAMYRSDLLKERIQLRDNLNIPKERYLSFIHPTAYVAKSVRMGQANIVLANCSINCNAVLGDFNTMNTNSSIGHDTVLEIIILSLLIPVSVVV